MPTGVRPGDTLADRYLLEDLLSESGTGRFWLAHDQVLQRHVALHTIGCDDDRAPGLLDAARRSATVVDPRILRVLDAQMRSDVCFVVNEWGYGTSLDIALANNGPLSPRRAAWVVGEVAESVAVAHSHGVHHGRLVPENVLVDGNGGVRIIGFAVDAALHGLPPGEEASDVRDLGGLLHASLTGKWAGDSSSAVPPAPQDGSRVLRPRQVRAGVPRPLDDLVDDVLNPDTARTRPLGEDASAVTISSYLCAFVGDPAGIAGSLAEANPIRPPEVVVLDQVPEIALRAGETDPQPPAPVLTSTSTARPLFAPEPESDERARAQARAERVARAGERPAATGTGATTPSGPSRPAGRPHKAARSGPPWLAIAAVVAVAMLALIAFTAVSMRG